MIRRYELTRQSAPHARGFAFGPAARSGENLTGSAAWFTGGFVRALSEYGLWKCVFCWKFDEGYRKLPISHSTTQGEQYMSDKAAVTAKVQQILAENFTVQLDSDGDYILDYESARMYVRVWQAEPDRPVFINLYAPFLWKLTPSPELFEYVALHSDDYVFGHMSAVRVDDGSITLRFTHQILGDYLDSMELIHSVRAVLGTTNDLDDELKERFGGERFREI